MSAEKKEKTRPRRFLELYSFVVPKLDGYRWRLPLTISLGFTEIAILIFVPLTSAKIINSLIASSWPSFQRHVLTLIILVLAQTIVSFLHRYSLLVTDERLGNGLRGTIVEKVLSKGLSFFERNWLGDIVSRTVNDSSVVQGFLTKVLIQIVYDGVSLVIVVFILMRMNPVLGALTVATAPVTILYGRLVRRRLEEVTLRVRESVAAVTSHLQSWLSRPLTIKLHTLEPQVARRFKLQNDELTDRAIRAGSLNAKVGATSTALLSIPSLLIFAYGGYLTLAGQLSIGDLFAFMAYTSYFNGPIQRLIGILVTTLPTMYPVYDRIHEFLAEGESEPSLLAPGKARVERIRVSDLEFAFEGKPQTQITIPSLVFTRGEIVGITGPNGSGKTTLSRLLLGIYRPTSGDISVELSNGEAVSAAVGRRFFGCVPQSPALFDGTLSENVTLFDSKPDLDKLSELELDLELSSWINSLPKGWETEINAGMAQTMSGGQAQKLGLARLLYREAPILMFDEPTSSLDATTQALFERVLRTPRADQIVIAITHSRFLLDLCDRVYTLQPRDAGLTTLVEEPKAGQLVAATSETRSSLH